MSIHQQRKIIHIDMDAFFASVEQRDHPEWQGKPLIVGGSSERRGVVAAASYEARRFGVRSAMSAAKAYRLCPHAIFVSPNFSHYRQASLGIHAIFQRWTDQIEPLSLDEAYLDLTTNHAHETSATRIAQQIKQAIRAELNLVASAGVGPNKLVAKIASDADKPDGLCVVPPAQVSDFLAPLPIRAIPGIGPKSAARCHEHDVITIADLRTADQDTLTACFGNHGNHFQELAWGRDQRPVRTNRERRSVGIEDTFAADLNTHHQAQVELERLTDGLVTRLHKAGVRGHTITLKVKFNDFTQITRSHTLNSATDDANTIFECAVALMAATEIGQRPIRLLGVSLSHLDDSGAVQQQLKLE